MAKKTASRPVEPPLASITVSIEVPVDSRRLFSVASDPQQLPKWADPIKGVSKDGDKPCVDYQLPNGRVTCPCEGAVDEERGTADWIVHIPGGDPLKVFSRIVPTGESTSVFILTLVSPPYSQHRTKNARAVMEKNLSRDLERLKALVEKK